MNKHCHLIPAAITAAALAGCAPPQLTPLRYADSGSMRVQHVWFARVVAVRRITIRRSRTGAEVGAGASALGGAGIGAAFGGGRGALIGGAIGLLAGAMVGSQHVEPGVLVTVQFPNGNALAIPQPLVKGVKFSPGERVEIVGNNKRVRVLPLN